MTTLAFSFDNLQEVPDFDSLRLNPSS
ncbi:hypothetical protein CCACVL1_30082 [Corchorus capsularis]|uniref:Uncharacterized protein n=1 Tax=Corchorus capsularis TaxID=210143 RepID=A0A1R3FYX8_COCAP|nr:hypothetical protein CCACVL1_30082 [Corchorus capsularis]